MSKWQVWELDVWGNEEEGWDINDWWKIKVIDLPENPTNQQVIQALYDAEILRTTDMAKFTLEWLTPDKCGVNCVAGDMPLYDVERITE